MSIDMLRRQIIKDIFIGQSFLKIISTEHLSSLEASDGYLHVDISLYEHTFSPGFKFQTILNIIVDPDGHRLSQVILCNVDRAQR